VNKSKWQKSWGWKALVGVTAIVLILVSFTTVVQTAVAQEGETREEELLRLDQVYRSQGAEAWMSAAGATWNANTFEARQPEEDIIQGHITVVGLQLKAQNLKVNWPACLTTDRKNEVTTTAGTKQVQPDLRNESIVYTNIILNGQGTFYARCDDWGQLAPEEAVSPTSTPTPESTLSPTASPTPTEEVEEPPEQVETPDPTTVPSTEEVEEETEEVEEPSNPVEVDWNSGPAWAQILIFFVARFWQIVGCVSFVVTGLVVYLATRRRNRQNGS
jgi:hypothetical protein